MHDAIHNTEPQSEAAVSQIARLLSELIGQAILFNDQVARAAGISAVDLQVLGIVTRSEVPTNPSTIATKSGLPPSTTTRVLDRLESAGYVTRHSDPSDRRRSTIEPVAAKTDAVAARYASKLEEIRQLNASRTDVEIAAVIAYLSELTGTE